MLLAVAATARLVFRPQRRERTLALPALGMCLLVVVQITLGALVVLTRKAVVPNTVHVATGAALLATSLTLTLQSWRLARLARRSAALAESPQDADNLAAPARRPLEAAREAVS